MDLKDKLERKKKLVDEALHEFLPSIDTTPATIHKAIHYSIFAGGKRLRPILAMGAAEAVGGKIEIALPAACAIEMIHTYSLIHDDLPALDNDDLRRGQPTNHKVFGEDMAILAGDALLTQAFFLLTKQYTMSDVEPGLVLQVVKEISEAAGSCGMIGGQVVDLESENKEINFETLKYIHNNKTGALFRVSLRAGAILGGGTDEEIEKLTNYANNFGLAFQITDDILDVIGNANIIGKPVGSDIKNNKATYPAIFGLEKSKKMAQEAINKALDELNSFGSKADFLKELGLYLIGREY